MNEGGQPSNLRPVSKEPWSADADLHELEQNHRPGSLLGHRLFEVSQPDFVKQKKLVNPWESQVRWCSECRLERIPN